MSLTDQAKALYGWATELLGGHRILFIHAPKCGGTSVGRALRRAYILSQATVKPHESEMAYNAARRQDQPALGSVAELREMMLLYLLYCDTRCVSAHVPFSNVAMEKFGKRYHFVTLLRDPVQRFISHYNWEKRPGSPWPIAGSLEEFVDSKRAKRMGSTYVRYFCGDPGVTEFAAKHADAAIMNIRRLDAVGFLDDVIGFESVLRRLTGRRVSIGRENIGNSVSKVPGIQTDGLEGRLLAACSADRAVWDAVQDLRGRTATIAAQSSA